MKDALEVTKSTTIGPVIFLRQTMRSSVVVAQAAAHRLELLARLVNLESEAVQGRQRQSSAEQALAAAQQRIQQLSSGNCAPTTSAGVIDTGTLGKPKSFTG